MRLWSRRFSCECLTAALAALISLQVLCLLAFAVDTGRPPARGGMLEVWWVNGRPGLTAATFAVIVIGPLLSALLWLTRSWRRWAMVAAWLGFALLLGAANFEKMQSITRVVWDRKVEPAIRR